MTREQAIKEFRKHWRWVAENPLEGKGAYVPSRDWENNCALCQHGCDQNCGCKGCPIKWPIKFKCLNQKSPYEKYREEYYGGTRDPKKLSAYATEIANLPERKV